MQGQAEVGRVSGIPVVLDFSFILLIVLWGYHYFTSADLATILMGLWIVGGVAASILIHELAHAFAGRRYGVGTTHVELNGLGGLCYYDRGAPSRWAQIVMSLAGPASNLALWGLFSAAVYGLEALPAEAFDDTAVAYFHSIAGTLGAVNFMLFWFNLLPSHPLDGGRALATALSGWIGYDRAMRLVAWLGMGVVAWLALMATRYGVFTALIALYLFIHNQRALDTHRGPRWKRWDRM
jgi:stage IV sporulation protein FB